MGDMKNVLKCILFVAFIAYLFRLAKMWAEVIGPAPVFIMVMLVGVIIFQADYIRTNIELTQ